MSLVVPSKIDLLCHMSQLHVKGNAHFSVKVARAVMEIITLQTSNFSDLFLVKQMSKPNFIH